MKVKAIIKTPKGQAKKTEGRIQNFILGLKKFKSFKSYVNADDSEILWEIEDSPRTIIKISRNMALFDSIMSGVLNSRIVQKTLRKRLDGEDEQTLKDMLLKQTKLEVIKEATAEEIVDSNKSFWEKLKEKFKRKDLT